MATPVSSPPRHVRWHAIKPELEHVAEARQHVRDHLRQMRVPDEHADDVLRVADELTANAVKATIAAPSPPAGVLANVSVGVECAPGYTVVEVRDPVPVRPCPDGPYEDDDEDGGEMHGLGLGVIVEALAVCWWTRMRAHDKTVVAVVARPGVTLPADVLRGLR